MKKVISVLALVAIVAFAVWTFSNTKGDNSVTNSDGQTLVFNLNSDQVLHFAWYPKANEKLKSIPVTEMIARKDSTVRLEKTKDGWENAQLSINVDRKSLCFTLYDKARNYEAGRMCPLNLGQKSSGISITAPGMQNAYGLGEQFQTPGQTEGDWMGKVRDSGRDEAENNRGQHFGNNMHAYNGGAVSNATFPILFAVGSENKNFAFLFDNTYKQRWDFTSPTWKVETSGGALQGFVIVGADLPALRREYMDLTGRPPVPPKKAFGLWVSEYGYDNWGELEGKLKTLRANNFPVDGFVLDLQWFGGIITNDENSPMGGLTWDLKNFPDPAGKIASFKKDENLGIVVIEEPYISRKVPDPATGRPVHDLFEEKGYLATEKPEKGSKAAFINYNPWWGRGGIYDYINPEAASFMHDFRRKALVDMGVTGHWTDLGEPEMFEPNAFYDNGRLQHGDIHNVYNLLWSKSIIDGYQRHKVQRRPWILSRSGTSGSQRYGVAMWSGDIGSNLTSLSAHLNAQMHMSFSGMDYFGSDIGGFHRQSVQGDMNEMFTQWFAVGSLLDVPVRVHTFNLGNDRETAPDRIGDKASNLFNLRLRYALNPFYYSLAHIAFDKGDAMFAPLAYHFQNDLQARKLGDHKMVGPNLLAVTISRHGQKATDVYLPKGNWYDFHNGQQIQSQGEWRKTVSAMDGKIFRLPMFAREGAIFPMARVTEATRSTNEGSEQDLVVRVYPGPQDSDFTLIEDDGETMAYQSGAVRRTKISQKEEDGRVVITLDSANGSFEGAAQEGNVWIEAALRQQMPTKITFNGEEIPAAKSRAELDKQARGWIVGANGFVQVKTSGLDRTKASVWKIEFR
jgi:alpha-glucosidase (family GH31 glycosyl hydrolase)